MVTQVTLRLRTDLQRAPIMPPKKATSIRTAQSAGLEDHTSTTSKNLRPEHPKVNGPEASASLAAKQKVKEAKSTT